MARETKLTPDVHRKIVTYLRAGAYLTHAVKAAGCSYDAVKSWIKRGNSSPDEPYASFAADVEQARAEVAVRAIGAISKAEAGGDWKAAAWKLERMFPKLYGVRSTHEIEAGVNLKAELIPQLRAYYGMHGLASETPQPKLPAPSSEEPDDGDGRA